MSKTSCLLSEDQFRCFVCQNVFTDPVTTPCGHNFCKNCVSVTLRADVPIQCPMCQTMFYPRLELQVNTLMAEVLDILRRSARLQNQDPEASGRSFSKRIIAIIFCAMVALFMLSSQVKHKPLTVETEGEKPGKAEGNVHDMEIKVCSQQKKEDYWTFSSTSRCQNLTSGHMELLSASNLVQIFTEVMAKEIPRVLVRAELMKAQRYAVNVTLDPDTAHPKLILSHDSKQVRCCNPKKNLPHQHNRFMHIKYVLGKQSFSSGRFYFEVQVKGKSNWTLGVAKESVKRMVLVRLNPQSGFWSLSMRNGNEYRGLSEPPVRFSLQSVPEKVGVFVDYEEGLVFFYDIGAAALIYTFTGCSFTGRLHPFLGPGHNYDGTNGEPLVMAPGLLPE